MTFSLDTNAVVDVARAVQARFRTAVGSGDSMVVSAVVWHEFKLGALISLDPAKELAALGEVLAGLDTAAFTLEDADATVALRAQLRPRGREIGAYDTLIAGQALARGWTVVTANTREFERVAGLSWVDWTRPEAGGSG